jgi:hypothetical protein
MDRSFSSDAATPPHAAVNVQDELLLRDPALLIYEESRKGFNARPTSAVAARRQVDVPDCSILQQSAHAAPCHLLRHSIQKLCIVVCLITWFCVEK